MSAKYRASAAHRWMTCCGSAELEALMPERTSAEALEGQWAHVELERCVSQDMPMNEWPDDPYLRRVLQLYSSLLWEARWTIKLDVFSETFMALSDDVGGTPDIAIVDHDNKLGVIIDLKWGIGVKVKAINNPQLAIYACALAQCHKLQHVDAYIAQPRIEEQPQLWSMNQQLLTAWRNKILDAAERCKEHKELYVPSVAACRFCNACAICPALAEMGREAMEEMRA